MEKGLVHIYFGDGKGKTTAAIGLTIRCAGGGGNVIFMQFIKDGKSSETELLKSIKNIEIMPYYDNVKFVKYMTDKEKEQATEFYVNSFEQIIKKVKENKFDLLILDEVLHAINNGFIKEEKLIDFIKNKPCGLEVVLTGRNPSQDLMDIADYITEMKKIKHPFDKGIMARKLIEM